MGQVVLAGQSGRLEESNPSFISQDTLNVAIIQGQDMATPNSFNRVVLD